MGQLAHVLSNLVATNEIHGGAFALFDGSRLLHAGAVGTGRGDLPLSINSYVRVASISKLATMLCFMKLYEARKVSLDSDISPQLGFTLRNPNFPNKIITPRMVLSHTSSVRDSDNYVGRIGETLESFFTPNSENWANGAHWGKQNIGYFSYSNLGMGLIAQIIERASQMRFDIAVKKLVFDPIGIECGFNWSGIADEDVVYSSPLFRRANSGIEWKIQTDGNPISLTRPVHNLKEGKILSDYEIGTNGLVFSPQGGLRANIIHLVKLAQVFSGIVPLLKAKTLADIIKPQWTFNGENGEGEIENGVESGAFLSFGTGIHRIIKSNNSPITGLNCELIGHYGQAYGLLGGLWLNPTNGKGFAWFINGSLDSPQNGAHSGVTLIEETIMQAAAQDLSLCE